MTRTWPWEDMDDVGEEEPRLLPDLWIEPDDIYASCGLTEQASGKRLAVQWSQCGGVAHVHCADDCHPDPDDDDEEHKSVVCGNCRAWTPEVAAHHAEQRTPLVPRTVPHGDDGGPFELPEGETSHDHH